MLNEYDLSALLVTIKLASITTVILILVGTPIAWWLSQTRFKFKAVIEAIIALPLILPPTVLGFYLLMTLGTNGPIGNFLESLGGSSIAFTFTGLVVGSVIYSLPFVVQPLQNSFGSIGKQPMEVAATLGASKLDRFFTVAVPLARSGFITASVLGFAHTVGEFGVVLMIGGNIPGETGVLSIAIYDHVEAMEYGQAHLLAGGLLVLSFVMLLVVYIFNRRFSIMRSN
ncbi:MAG: molybdate ABC transporter permease subunit [Candidatus Thioglobus sp.]|jgi:molybdate transport system permease protein|nr:molybdate ABC transporter permease subunit [Candidatus Pseudothioglobus aerophilus]MBT3439371.1 molybdate ABC transporter permease subunit [Gammaproteobacteria bacterium]MDP0559620.1 molybdate ABC transporter permease subunit [Candidatus Thioglobus sp.]MBT4244839.1 molybdate ABC transporter permease subunit [Gammaproteobacteria bacterium]MBT4586965.1 molybdate ABC transporter permease subunit [Gammaproteobacteria bacterium]